MFRYSQVLCRAMLVVLPVLLTPLLAQDDIELNTVLMESTFKIGGPMHPPKQGFTVGTGFIIGRPIVLSLRAWYVLVTAAHVLDEIEGETLTVVFRRKQPDGSYVPVEIPIPLRAGPKNLYAKHSTADVAAIYVDVPNGFEIPLLSENFLADEKTIQDLKVHPGSDLNALGYPFGDAANDWLFPILRSGKLASYPLTPITLVQTFLFDFHVYEGNSGGPVYLVEPRSTLAPPNRIPLGGNVQTILGLVSGQQFKDARLDTRLELGVIVPSQFIRETIELLPFEPPSESLRRQFPKMFQSIIKPK